MVLILTNDPSKYPSKELLGVLVLLAFGFGYSFSPFKGVQYRVFILLYVAWKVLAKPPPCRALFIMCPHLAKATTVRSNPLKLKRFVIPPSHFGSLDPRIILSYVSSMFPS